MTNQKPAEIFQGTLIYKGNDLYTVPDQYKEIFRVAACGVDITSYEKINTSTIKMCELPLDCNCPQVWYTKIERACEACDC